MKRMILAAILFSGASVEAKTLSQVWHSIAPKSRVVSGMKAAVVAFIAYQAAHVSLINATALLRQVSKDVPLKEKGLVGTRQALTAVATGYASWQLLSEYFAEHVKHALAL